MIDLLKQVGEFIRLYGWIPFPPFLGIMTLLAMRPDKPKRWLVAWILFDITWLVSRWISVHCGRYDSWAPAAVTDVLAGCAFFELAWRCPGRARRVFASVVMLEAVEVLISCAYGLSLIVVDYSKFNERIWYWSCFGLAWGQALVVTQRGLGNGHRNRRDYLVLGGWFSLRPIRMRVAGLLSARSGGN